MSLRCKLLGHKFKTTTISFEHAAGNKIIWNYAGRVEEIRRKQKCVYCDKVLLSSEYNELDNFYIDSERTIKTNKLNDHLNDYESFKNDLVNRRKQCEKEKKEKNKKTVFIK